MPIIKQCILNNVVSAKEVYEALDKAYGLPDHFGNNLDALYDFLSNDLIGPAQIVWQNDKDKLPFDQQEGITGIKAVLMAAANQREDFYLVLGVMVDNNLMHAY